jgi:hypothetical protein
MGPKKKGKKAEEAPPLDPKEEERLVSPHSCCTDHRLHS